MNLAIFDIDGTLTKTDHIDDICFVQALADAYAITGVSTDWAGYSHTTDSGITLDIFRERFNRAPEETELLKFKSYFLRLLENINQLYLMNKGESQAKLAFPAPCTSA